jgi:hypothetical protein
VDSITKISDQLCVSCTFNTRVHAEALIADRFQSNQSSYFGGDGCIGRCRLSCFCYYDDVDKLCAGGALDGSHNKIYTHWKPLEINNDRRRVGALDYLIRRVRDQCTNVVDVAGGLVFVIILLQGRYLISAHHVLLASTSPLMSTDFQAYLTEAENETGRTTKHPLRP